MARGTRAAVAISGDESRPMNILIVHWGRNGAGPRFTRAVATALSAQPGLNVHLSYSVDSESARLNEQLGVQTVPFRTYQSAASMILGVGRMVRNALHLRRYIKQNEIDAVVSPMYSIWQSLSLPILLPRNVPYLASIHDARPHAGDNALVVRICYLLEFAYARSVITYSKSVADQVRPRLRADQRLGSTVHGTFRPEAGNAGGDRDRRPPPWRIGMFGRLNPYKGVDIFAEAIGLLHESGVAVEGVVYGSGGADLERLALCHPEVEWVLGWVSEDAVNQIVGSFDVLALPYREASQSGVVAVAVAEGVPIVATPVGGLSEQVNESRAGVLSTSVDARSFADAIHRVILEPGLYEELRANSIRAAESIYSWDNVGRDIESMIRDVVV
jgi:glycosyltransferase involved in cell wall biosynthesis